MPPLAGTGVVSGNDRPPMYDEVGSAPVPGSARGPVRVVVPASPVALSRSRCRRSPVRRRPRSSVFRGSRGPPDPPVAPGPRRAGLLSGQAVIGRHVSRPRRVPAAGRRGAGAGRRNLGSVRGSRHRHLSVGAAGGCAVTAGPRWRLDQRGPAPSLSELWCDRISYRSPRPSSRGGSLPPPTATGRSGEGRGCHRGGGRGTVGGNRLIPVPGAAAVLRGFVRPDRCGGRDHDCLHPCRGCCGRRRGGGGDRGRRLLVGRLRNLTRRFGRRLLHPVPAPAEPSPPLRPSTGLCLRRPSRREHDEKQDQNDREGDVNGSPVRHGD